MKKRFVKKKQEEKKIAKERISKLFLMAQKMFKEDPKLSHRYVTLARKISMKYKVRIKPEFKRKFCKHCYKFLMPGVNCRVRFNEGKVVYYCRECKKYIRFPHVKEKK